MGFDLSGIKPTSEEGQAFRANVWYWRPIWAFIKQELPDLLTPSQVRGGEYNDGTIVDAKQATEIGNHIIDNITEISAGIEDYEKQRKADLKKDPDNFGASYGMDVELMIEFASFCKNSGGFEIW